jgi:hypothetical protein
MANDKKRYAHLYITYLGRWIVNATVVTPIVYVYLTYK